MKVKELVAALRLLDQEAEVLGTETVFAHETLAGGHEEETFTYKVEGILSTLGEGFILLDLSYNPAIDVEVKEELSNANRRS